MMETERLILRPWLESDAEALFKYACDLLQCEGIHHTVVRLLRGQSCIWPRDGEMRIRRYRQGEHV